MLQARDVCIAVFVYALNLFDMFATLKVLREGGEELNPFMRILISIDPLLFVLYKVVLVALFISLFLFYPFTKRINPILSFAAGVYTMLCYYHLLILFG